MSVIIVVISAERNKVQWRGLVAGKTLSEPRNIQSKASASKPRISALPDGLDGLLLADRSHSRHRASIGARTLDIVGTQRMSRPRLLFGGTPFMDGYWLGYP
jgi:hypothetical protein